MLTRLIAGLALGVALLAPAARAADLEPGKPAPTLENVTWLKGDPISKWEKGQVYVLDFWATWCGPCVASIPHLNTLQQDFSDKGVHVIGVAIWPTATMTPTKDFVEGRGDKMGYTIAEDVDGKTAGAYMTAAGRSGIPTVFVVGKDGNVAWIGHPMQGLEDVVELIVNDKFSPEAEAERQQELEKKQLAMGEMVNRLRGAYLGSNWEEVAKVSDEMLAFDQELMSAAAVYKYIALAKLGDTETPSRARVWGTHVISTLYADDPESLNAFAWHVVGPESELTGDEVDAELALAAAQRAAELTNHEDVNVLDTLARAYFSNGETRKAADTEEAAIAVVNEEIEKAAGQPDAIAQLQAVKEQLETRRSEYEKATASSDDS